MSDLVILNNLTITPDRNPVVVYLAALAPGSRRSIETALQLVLDTFTGPSDLRQIRDFPWWGFRYQHLMAVRAKLAETYAPATVNKALVATRQVLRYCRRLGLMTADECSTASDLPSVRGSRLPRGRALSQAELDRLLDETQPDTQLGIRNHAVLSLLAHGGLRRAEVSQLQLDDYDPQNRTMRVRGKGNKERSVPINRSLAKTLDRWIETRGVDEGPLFCRGSKGDHIFPGKPFSSQGIYFIVGELARQAKVLKISPHDFRRTFISALLNDHDIATVSKLVGHASVTTTARYDRRDEKSQRNAVESLVHEHNQVRGASRKRRKTRARIGVLLSK